MLGLGYSLRKVPVGLLVDQACNMKKKNKIGRLQSIWPGKVRVLLPKMGKSRGQAFPFFKHNIGIPS